MSTKNVTLKEKVNGVLGDTIFPATTTPNVYDSAKSQALSQTLVNTPDYEALGFAKFSTATAYNAGDKVYKDNRLYRFIADKTAGEWDVAKVEPWSIEQEIEAVDDAIRSLIPAQASADNKLADKEYVNDKVSTDTATFRGTFNLVTDLELTTDATQGQIATALGTAISGEDKNDYAFVQIPTSDATPTEIARIDRYKYTGLQWAFEYSLNNSGFTAEQWAAINSGITSSLVTAFGAKYDKPAGGIPKTDLAEAVQTSLNKADTAMQPTDVAELAKNIDSWMHTDAIVEDRFADLVRTTAGDVSILSDRGGKMKSIVALTDFKATEFRATGFNLLRDAVAVGDGYFFLVPPMRFGEFGTAAEANGVLFTNSNNENLTPTVYFKPLSEGEPQTTTDGTLCAFTDSHGYRFFTTSEVGFLVVSGITLNQTCAHVGWSRRYDEYIAVDAASDAGGSVPLTAILAALHASGDYAGWMLTVGDAADRIDWLTDGVATWTRNVNYATPTWTTEADPETEGVYIHTATIAAMKEGGAAKFMTEDIGLNVSGNTITYSDDSATAVSDAVKYELAVPATGTVDVNNLYTLNDWGLEKYRNVLGTAATQSNYKQDVKDTVRSLATVQFDNTVRVLTEALVQCREDINRLKSELDAVKEQINS